MKGSTLHQRLACGATPRRCWPASARPGTRVCVIVPSKDNASGSSGKRVPLLWTFSDLGGGGGGLRGVLQHRQRLEVLEEVFRGDAAEEQQAGGQGQEEQDPDILIAALMAEAMAEARVRAAAGAAAEVVAVEEEEEMAVLRERIQSAAMASTSAPSAAVPITVGAAAGSGAEGGRLSGHHHQHPRQHSFSPQQQHQQQGAPASAPPRTDSPLGGAALNGAPAPYTSGSSGSNGSSGSGGGGAAAVPLPRASHSHQHEQHLHHDQQQHQQHVRQQHQQHVERHVPQQHSAAASSPTAPAAMTTEGHQLDLLDHHHHHHHQEHQQQQPLPGGPTAPPPPLQPHHHHQEHIDEQQQQRAAVAAPASTAPAAAASVSPDSGASIPGSIWILCFISAALTCASCVFNTALPIYMVSELKMSMRSMGMFEGLLEAFSYVVRMCSGVVSDRMTSRKAAITLGFAAGAAAKFGMASAGTVGLLFAGKAVDRLANGIQAAPRDALIGDLSPAGVRSACFGLAQSLRKWGSAVGALAAFFLMKASNNNYQLIFYSAATVSLIACFAFVFLVPAHTRVPTPKAPEAAQQPAAAAASPSSASAPASGVSAAFAPTASGPSRLLSGGREFFRSVASMGVDFYRMLGVISLYALGHINESLLEARAMEVGFGKAEATLVVAAIAAVTFLTAYPLGLLDDRYGAGTTFAVGISALIAGDLVLLLSGPHPLALFASCLFLGVHWAVIQGPLLSIVSGLAPAHMRGTAFGIFYTVMAFTAVAANTMYGSIWHTYGANAAFMTSAALMSAVLAALPYMLPACARRGAAANAAAAAGASSPAVALSPPAVPPFGGGKAAGLVPSALPAAA